jgi:hypothetical protein
MKTQDIKERCRKFKRAWGTWYAFDNVTGRRRGCCVREGGSRGDEKPELDSKQIVSSGTLFGVGSVKKMTIPDQKTGKEVAK